VATHGSYGWTTRGSTRNLGQRSVSTQRPRTPAFERCAPDYPDWLPPDVRRIESGERRVDVDDLVALALALGVSPLALMLPTEDSSLVPDGDQYPVDRIWNWASGSKSLSEQDAFRFMRDSNPLYDWTGAEERIATEVVKLPRKSEVSRGHD
jgi:transcriptional regulator with XRE-family HTH domain